MASFKLSYFNTPGRAEVTRILFKLAGQEFEDVRFSQDQWKAEKSSGKYPLEQVPVLETAGITLCQSFAIEKYVANEFGFAGKTNIEKAMVDNICLTLREAGESMVAFAYGETDEARKAEKKERAFGDIIPKRLAYLESLLKSNNDGKGYIVGDSITVADVGIYHSSFFIKVLGGENLLEKTPALKDLVARVGAHPIIAKHVAERDAK